MWSVARRPRWIAALALALVVAAVFAGLSQWQLARSYTTGAVLTRDTETVVPLASLASPQSPVTDVSNGHIVRTTGVWNAGDYVIVSDRLNDGVAGYWVVGHFSAVQPTADSTNALLSGSVGLAVAVGWAKDRSGASSALSQLRNTTAGQSVTITGRYFPGEGPQDSNFEKSELSTMSPGQLINVWRTADAAGVYGGYLVAASSPAGLVTIDSPIPSTDIELNLLNIFYAIEWVVFAGFAIFLWFRLVKDAWEREEEEMLDAEGVDLAPVN